MIFEFKKEQLLVQYDKDPVEESKNPNDIIEVKILQTGDKTILYKVDETVLVRRGYVEDIKSPYFKENEKIIFDENKVLCKFQK